MLLPRNGARSPSGMPEADAEGVFSLDWTQYDMINEGTILNLNCILNFEFPAFPQTPCGQNSESRQKTLVEENGILVPKIYVSIFRVLLN